MSKDFLLAPEVKQLSLELSSSFLRIEHYWPTKWTLADLLKKHLLGSDALQRFVDFSQNLSTIKLIADRGIFGKPTPVHTFDFDDLINFLDTQLEGAGTIVREEDCVGRTKCKPAIWKAKKGKLKWVKEED